MSLLLCGASCSKKSKKDVLAIPRSTNMVKLVFNERRVRLLSQADSVLKNSHGVVYWMLRDQRVQDNWAMIYAQKLAIKNKIPLHVVFCLKPKCLGTTWRQNDFLLKGLREVGAECLKLDIKFHLLLGEAATVLPAFVAERHMGVVVSDFSPLREARAAVDAVNTALPENVPLCQVDAHNIVPCWVASEQAEYAAHTIRKKINGKLGEFLTLFPSVVTHPYPSEQHVEDVDWDGVEQSFEVDRLVGPVDWARPGTAAGMEMLQSFCVDRLDFFELRRNDPNAQAVSNLSPWLHFGQISAQRVALTVRALRNPSNESAVDLFCEELIVRRGLADNFCLYNEQYDSIQGAADWAKKTLDNHRGNVRDHLYSVQEWERALTHDPLWNAAQRQLVQEGKMHATIRSYWAKRLLEWSATPEAALATALFLNHRYSLDGGSANGYAGCMRAICGTHDRGWPAKQVFGTVLHANFAGLSRKFDVERFVARYRK